MPATAVSEFGVASMTAPLRRVLVRRPATEGDWADGGDRFWLDERTMAIDRESYDAMGCNVLAVRRASP